MVDNFVSSVRELVPVQDNAVSFYTLHLSVLHLPDIKTHPPSVSAPFWAYKKFTIPLSVLRFMGIKGPPPSVSDQRYGY